MKSLVRHLALLSVLLLAGSAGATTLTLDNCDAYGCAGSDVFLTVDSDGSGNWNITLGLDSTGYYGTQNGVVQAGFKAIGGISDADVTLVSFSDGSWSAAKVAGINGNGGALCDGPSDPDFVCTSGYANIETNKVYTWNFYVTGGTLLDVDSWAIKFQYCDQGDTDCKGHVLSAHSTGEPGNPVPEPSAALVFGGGLLAAATRLRRRR